ncbi:MAG: response regulator [Calothrix sp. C42_A2020_038]|nr:response regulator [Calothrix sp. C42_A2020_038]
MKTDKTILVVDDEEQNFDVVEILLFKEGYNLQFAQSGNDALNFLEKHKVDTVLLDVMMPDVNGIEVCQQIRGNQQLPYIPIVMVTALSTKEDLARCLEAGADDFVSKPVSGVELRAKVNSMLRIKQKYDFLKDSLDLRGDMENMIVHDFSNHLVSIILGCEILRASDSNQSRKDRQLQLMENSARQLQSLTDSLLMLAKLESGKMLIRPQEVMLREIIESVLEDFDLLATQKKIQILHNLESIHHKIVHLDAHIMRRVLDNLVSNAIKFSPNQAQINIYIEYPEDLQFRIKIIDQGRGINDDLKSKIFSKYEIGQSIQGVSQTGLGLAFCQLAVTAHQGRIWIEDNQPQGTVFTIEI